MKKKNKITIYVISAIIILAFLVWFFSPPEDLEGVVFLFNNTITNNLIGGEVYFDNEFYGYAQNGKIKISQMEELPKEILFKGEYEGEEFELIYDFPQDYLDFYEYEFLVDNLHKANNPPKVAKLHFYHVPTNCSLNGEIFLGNNSVGFSTNGEFNLSRKDYDSFWNGEISINGLTDSCFQRNNNLPFVEYWTIEDLDYYFETGEQMVFETEFNPRWPVYPKAMQGFIRPEEVEERYSKIRINENDSDLENLERIFGHSYMNYVSDSGRFGESEYWQTPSDFIMNKGGDCEDWAIYMESLIRRYSSSLDCYLAVWYTHVNILCNINQTFIILDQNKVRKNLVLDEDLSLQENQIKSRSWRNGYFKEYGISPDERILFYLINDEEIIQFENGQEDFIAWVLKKGKIKK